MYLDEKENVLVELGFVKSLEDHQAGRIQYLLMAMTAKQARDVADDLRKVAGRSRQSDNPGRA
jgi:hypothetical protein